MNVKYKEIQYSLDVSITLPKDLSDEDVLEYLRELLAWTLEHLTFDDLDSRIIP